MKGSSHDPEVLVTGRLWLGADGAPSIGSCLIELLEEAQNEIIIIAYRLTIAVPEFNTALEKALGRGCLVRIVMNRTGPAIASEDAHFNRLLKQFKTLSIWHFKEHGADGDNLALHAKVLLVDRKVGVVGSANFSRNGMIENHEIGLKISGAVARSVAVASDKLIENGLKEGLLYLQRVE